MKNSEILGFQFESTKSLQPDSSSDERWETCLSVDSADEYASVDTWRMCFNCSQIMEL